MITNWSEQMSDALVTVILIRLRVGSWRSWGGSGAFSKISEHQQHVLYMCECGLWDKVFSRGDFRLHPWYSMGPTLSRGRPEVLSTRQFLMFHHTVFKGTGLVLFPSTQHTVSSSQQQNQWVEHVAGGVRGY